jgi:hypothetical protein
MRVARDHEVNPTRELGVRSVRIVGEDDSTGRFRDLAQDIVKRPMVLPQVSGTRYPETLSALLDGLRLVPQVLIGLLEPVLGSRCVSPMIVVSEYRVHTERSFQLSKQRPYRVDLGGRRPLMDVVARANDHITVETVRSSDHVPDNRQGNK